MAKVFEVLVIEDNPADVRLLAEAFGSPEGIHIRVARDGEEGLEMISGPKLQSWRPDLILLDLNLPKLNGHDVLTRIKADRATRSIPVIVLTSSRAEADIRKAYEAHANAYLRKPSTLDDLYETANNIKAFWLNTATLPQ